MVNRIVRACEQPTKKFPYGRTGTPAGYGAHRYAGEAQCVECQEAHNARQSARHGAMTAEQLARKQECNRLAAAKQRAANPDAVLAAKHKRFMANKTVMRAAKAEPCTDCGIVYPYYVMQFDHLGDKAFQIGPIGPGASRERLLAEIAKCEVVCANCHAERSHQRLMIKLGRAQ